MHIAIWTNGPALYPIAGPSVTLIPGSTTINAKSTLNGGMGAIPFKTGPIISGSAVAAAIDSTRDAITSRISATPTTAAAGTPTTKAATTTTKASTETTKAATTTKASDPAALTTVKSCKVSTKKIGKGNPRQAETRVQL